MKPGKFLHFYILLFFASGFSGLIYESIWSQYLKLFLGHAAYAQTLVLSIFMLGLAIGGYCVSISERRLPNLLIAYAVVEMVIGLFALLFHNGFVMITGFAYDQLIPGMASPQSVELLKWTLGVLLILPQSILLGATFPLMAGGIINHYPDRNGWNLATLYFANSFGAAIGVLINGFVFIPAVGLPGALLTGGLMNVVIAISVYLLAKSEIEIPPRQPTALDSTPSIRLSTAGSNLNLRHVLLLVAAFTGMASFMYEIAWIRMLSLVFGSSTYSFEVMLSAFILGIAIGGLWIRKYIDKFANPVAALGVIQLVMGALAAMSLVFYLQSFDVMVWTIAALDRTDEGYFLFNLINYGVASIVMLPVTICAGMTLPLITKVLVDREQGNAPIGQVYAFNTLGSIAGVILASQIVLPMAGLKPLILAGAATDIALGLLLIAMVYRHSREILWRAGPALAVWVLVAAFLMFDPLVLSSGVFRRGALLDPAVSENLYYRDGKSSTVSITENIDDVRVIANNGKPDAALRMADENGVLVQPTPDEPTMMLLPVLGLAILPDAKLVANVGFGSGLTAHTLLGHGGLEMVDSIEIEPAVVEAARLFGSRVERAYTDPRSNIIIGDAKTYFVNNGDQYDMIIAEPSNPWVSGVATLFSQEYYGLTRRYLKPDGIFLQWLQLYEIEERLVASIYKALRSQFSTVAFYQVSVNDVVMVAGNSDFRLDGLDPALFTYPLLQEELERIGIESVSDLNIRHLASHEVMDLVFGLETVNANSDYFPLVDTVAPKNLFKRDSATRIYNLHRSYFIGSKNLERGEINPAELHPGLSVDFLPFKLRSDNFQQIVLNLDLSRATSDITYRQAFVVLSALESCEANQQVPAPLGGQVIEVLADHVRNLDLNQFEALMSHFEAPGCMDVFNDQQQLWLGAMIAFGHGNHDTLLDEIKLLFSAPQIDGNPLNQLAMAWAYVAAIHTGRIEELVPLIQKYIAPPGQISLEFQILEQQAQLAYAGLLTL